MSLDKGAVWAEGISVYAVVVVVATQTPKAAQTFVFKCTHRSPV